MERWMWRVCAKIMLILPLANGADANVGDEAAVSGHPITSQDIKNANPVATFTPEQFLSASSQYLRQQCEKGTLKATSEGPKILLDGTSFSDDEFAAEVVRRSKQHPIYCLDIFGPGSDVKRTSALLKKLKGTEIVNVSWRP